MNNASVLNLDMQGFSFGGLETASVTSQSKGHCGLGLSNMFNHPDHSGLQPQWSATISQILEVGHPGITCEQPISCARNAWLHSSEWGALVGG